MLSDVAVVNAAVSRSLVVLPTYNERENIEPIVTAILDQGAEFDVDIRGRLTRARVVPMPFYKRRK